MNLHQFGEAGGEELVVFGSYDNFCYAVDAVSGEKRWEFETENYINGAVAIAEGWRCSAVVMAFFTFSMWRRERDWARSRSDLMSRARSG